MATSGSTNFTLDFADLAEEAWERAGREMRTGYDLVTARRSFDLMMIEWGNRGINLWTIEEGAVSLNVGVDSYPLPADTMDLLEQYISKDGHDIAVRRMSAAQYASIPNKTMRGRPNSLWIDRRRDSPVVVVWPVPDADSYGLGYMRLRRIQDSGDTYHTADVNYRFLPAATAGLAYYLSMKVPELMARTPMLKQVYEEQFDMAAAEDREKAPLRLVPRIK